MRYIADKACLALKRNILEYDSCLMKWILCYFYLSEKFGIKFTPFEYE